MFMLCNLPWSKNIGWRVQTRRMTMTWKGKSSWNRRAKACAPRAVGNAARCTAHAWEGRGLGRGLWGAARDNGRHRRRPTRGMIQDNTALRATRWHKAITTHRAMSHPVKRGCQANCVTFSHLYTLPKQDHKLIEGRFPLRNRLGPLFGDVLQPHIQHFDDRLVIGECTAPFQHLPQRVV